MMMMWMTDDCMAKMIIIMIMMMTMIMMMMIMTMIMMMMMMMLTSVAEWTSLAWVEWSGIRAPACSAIKIKMC